MINKDIDKTLDLLVKDGDYLPNFENKIEDFTSPSTTEEEKNQMIDMDADLYRLCQRDTVKASNWRAACKKRRSP